VICRGFSTDVEEPASQKATQGNPFRQAQGRAEINFGGVMAVWEGAGVHSSWFMVHCFNGN